jgi:DNA-binding IscR family transcriptional regulator
MTEVKVEGDEFLDDVDAVCRIRPDLWNEMSRILREEIDKIILEDLRKAAEDNG